MGWGHGTCVGCKGKAQQDMGRSESITGLQRQSCGCTAQCYWLNPSMDTTVRAQQHSQEPCNTSHPVLPSARALAARPITCCTKGPSSGHRSMDTSHGSLNTASSPCTAWDGASSSGHTCLHPWASRQEGTAFPKSLKKTKPPPWGRRDGWEACLLPSSQTQSASKGNHSAS